MILRISNPVEGNRNGGAVVHHPLTTFLEQRTQPSDRVSDTGMDPNPYWIRIQSGQWIRIHEAKNDPQK